MLSKVGDAGLVVVARAGIEVDTDGGSLSVRLVLLWVRRRERKGERTGDARGERGRRRTEATTSPLGRVDILVMGCAGAAVARHRTD